MIFAAAQRKRKSVFYVDFSDQKGLGGNPGFGVIQLWFSFPSLVVHLPERLHCVQASFIELDTYNSHPPTRFWVLEGVFVVSPFRRRGLRNVFFSVVGFGRCNGNTILSSLMGASE